MPKLIDSAVAPVLLPRPVWEAASSIARDLYMDSEAIVAARDRFAPGLAMGSASVPLAELARLTRGIYGDEFALLRDHTVFSYATIGSDVETAARQSQRIRRGTGRGAQSQLPASAAHRGNGIRTCPMCDPRVWARYGVCAFFAPHLPPFVCACPWDGCYLESRCPSPVPPSQIMTTPRPATRDEVEFSQMVLALCGESDRPRLAAKLHAELAGLNYLAADGRFRSRAFSDAFFAFCESLTVQPILRRLATSPLRSRQLLGWLSGGLTTNPAFITLLCMFVARRIEAPVSTGSTSGSTSGALVDDQIRKPKAWHARRQRPLPVDGRRRYRMADVPVLIDRGCTCAEMAHLVHMSVDSIYRYIRAHELREALINAQMRRIAGEAREAWLARIRTNPGASANQLARREPRLLAWLLRHDEAWVRANWPVPSHLKLGRRHDATGVHGRDASMAAHIRRAARQITRAQPTRRLTLAALRRQIGISAYVFTKLSRMQRVRAALDACLPSRVRTSRKTSI